MLIDIHTHILPGLDDGAKDMQESLELLRIAERQGIRGVIATPHASPQFPAASAEKILSMTEELQRKAREMGSRCVIYPGEEIMYREGVFEELQSGRLLTLAQSGYILLEFHYQVPYSELRRVVREAVRHGYRPVLAHIERYSCLREGGRLQEISADGAYLQMNFASLTGHWYSGEVSWCRQAVRQELIHFLATDMHSRTVRRPSAAEPLLWLNRRIEPRYLKKILSGNARKILNNERI